MKVGEVGETWVRFCFEEEEVKVKIIRFRWVEGDL